MKNLLKKLAAFQWEVPIIIKKTKGYGYDYADLPTIFEIIMPLLKKHGLGFYQIPTEKGMETTIFDVDSGECLTGVTPMPSNVTFKGMNDFQVDGSRITYYRRYSLSALLGLVTDKDTDAAGEQIRREQIKNPVSPRAISQIDWQSMHNKIEDGLESNDVVFLAKQLMEVYSELVKLGFRNNEDLDKFKSSLQEAMHEKETVVAYALKLTKLLERLAC